MKTFNALFLFALIACLSLPAAAQDVAGSWRAESVSGVEPPEDASLTLAFGDEDTATITYTLAGETQSWQYRYTIADGQLKLDPAKPFGEAQTITYDIKFDEGKLLLLSPKPKPVEEETEAEGEADPDADAQEAAEPEEDASGDEAAEEVAEGEGADGAEEELEEEDNRVPVWILIKA
jgi:hypothetical protein